MVLVEHVSKKFSRSLRRVMLYGLADIASAAFLPARARSAGFHARVEDAHRMAGSAAAAGSDGTDAAPLLRPQEFWALKDVSFKIHRGECLGLIGPNGAGKSTMFKILSGILGPSDGRVEVRGRLTSLLEVGSGFHPMLSGRENVYISGAVLGMSTAEIDRKFEQIVDFSGVRDFIDMPVKFYSSGMHMRLGFAVLAHLDPEIMLIDEILAVGDLSFQKKCLERINQMRESDMAISFVSHSLSQVESLCERVVWLDHGGVQMIGPTKDVVRAYRDHEIVKRLRAGEGREGFIIDTGVMAIRSVELLKVDGSAGPRYAYGEDLVIRVHYMARERINQPRFGLVVAYQGAHLFEASMLIDGAAPEFIEGEGSITCRIHKPTLLPREYDLLAFVRSREGVVELIPHELVGGFLVTSEGLEAVPMSGPYALGHLMEHTAAVVHYDYDWDLRGAVKGGA